MRACSNIPCVLTKYKYIWDIWRNQLAAAQGLSYQKRYRKSMASSRHVRGILSARSMI